MKAYEGFKSEASGNSYPMLPVGAYVCEIKNVKIDGKEPDQRLILRLDIVEGEFTGYYPKRYEHDAGRNAQNHMYQTKYKGDFQLQIPNEANTDRAHPEWDIRTFNNMVFCVEQSNEGYKWDWNEKSLKGKLVGINVRAGTYNGNPYTQIGKLETVKDVRDGVCKTMRPKEDSNPPVSESSTPAFTPVETDELPF